VSEQTGDWHHYYYYYYYYYCTDWHWHWQRWMDAGSCQVSNEHGWGKAGRGGQSLSSTIHHQSECGRLVAKGKG